MGVTVQARVVAFIALLGAVALAGIWLGTTLDQPPGVAPATLAVLLPLLVAGEYLRVDFRYRDEVDSLNLFEAVLAPTLLVLTMPAAVLFVAVGQAAANLLRRNAPLKSVFNVAQWAAAAAAGSLVLRALDGGEPSASVGGLAALVVALLAVTVVNQMAFVAVLTISSGQRVQAVMAGLAPVIVPGWIVGWVVNASFGVLLAMTQLAAPVTTPVFAVPLVVLHGASRGFVRNRLERARLAGVQQAARTLAAPLDFRDAVPAFLHELCSCFDADAVELGLAGRRCTTVHRVTAAGAHSYCVDEQAPGTPPPAAGDGSSLTAVFENGPVADGWLTVHGRRGFQGFDDADRAVLDLVARDTASSIVKSRLVKRMINDRRRLAELGAVVDSSDDAIVGQSLDGRITTWSAGAERLYGYRHDDIVGRPAAVLVPADRADDEAWLLEQVWAGEAVRQHETERVRGDGSRVSVSLTASPVLGPDGRPVAVSTIARDMGERKRAEELARRLVQERQRRRHALGLNDQIVQELAVAAMALDLGEGTLARQAIDTTLGSARRIITDLLPTRRVAAGDLASRQAAQDLEEGGEQ